MAEWSYIDWAERIGTENLRGRLAVGDHLITQANTLLTLLVAGMGGAMLYGAKIFEPLPSPLAWGAAWVSIWLAFIATLLAAQCIVTKPTPALFNEPKNIYKPALELTEIAIREFEMERVQERIEQAKRRNAGIATWLDLCRYAALITPLVFGAAVVAAGR
jgi:hypothetical protein